MEGNIAATYTLIYHFLKQQCDDKAAQAVKKAAKAVVVLRDDIEQEGPTLQDIIKTWKAKENTKSAGSSESSSEESESSDDSDGSSGSEDESGSDSSSEDEDTSDDDDGSNKSDESTHKSPQKAAERDTSITLSSAGEIAGRAADKVVTIPVRQSTNSTDKPAKDEKTPKPESADTNSSDSDTSSENSTSDNSDAESSSSGSGSSSGSDSSSEDESNKIEKAPTNRIQTTASKSPSTSGSSSESDDESESEPQRKEDTHIAKKRKTSETGAAVATAVAAGLQQTAKVSQKKEKSSPALKERFQRVKVNNLAPEMLLNNGYEAKGGGSNDYGDRAHRDLIVTRGSGFRKEKNKKKRGSYRGGEITMENHSIKFDF